MITRLLVKNYKSLKSMDLRLRPLSVFVGPNNSGKSNILDAILLLSGLVNEGAGAVHSRGGYADIVWNAELRRSIAFSYEGKLRATKGKKFTYSLELAGGPQHFSLTKELLTVRTNATEKTLLEFQASSGNTEVFDEAGSQKGWVGATGSQP